MERKTRRVHFAGCTPNPQERWMKKIARNLTDTEDGFLSGKRSQTCQACEELVSISS